MDANVQGTETEMKKTIIAERFIKNDKEFGKRLTKISKQSDLLADDIHIAGLYALSQVNIHGQPSSAVRLIEAMGKKHDKVRVMKWLIHFGKLTVKDKVLVYKKRKDINPETVDAWAAKADAMPYWELTAQQEMTVTYDYYKMIESVLNKRKGIPELTSKGKQVDEVNEGLLDAIQEVFNKFNPVVVAK